MIRHIVMWKLKEENKEQNARTIKERLEALPNEIPEIKYISVQKNLNTQDAAFDLVLYSEFEDEKALETYQNHPAHKAVSAFVGGVRTDRVVGDVVIENR